MGSKLLNPLIFVALPLVLIACSGPASEAAADATLTPQERRGELLFDQYCETCHATHGDTVVVGPSLDGISDRAGERMQQYSSAEYIEYSIRQPGDYVVQGFSDLMPQELASTLTEEEIDALVAYLMTLD